MVSSLLCVLFFTPLVVEAAVLRGNGLNSRSPNNDSQHVNSSTHVNSTVSQFGTCTQACDQCFADHYQGCLARCHVGCQDFCEKRLPPPLCLQQQKWTADVGHLFQAFDSAARMCQATGLNGCPEPLPMDPTPQPPFDPYLEKQPGGKDGTLEATNYGRTEATRALAMSRHRNLALAKAAGH